MITEVKGVELDLHPYYRCRETEEPPCQIVWGGDLDYRMLLGPAAAEPPYPLWRRERYEVPPSVTLTRKVGETPCTKFPDEPHEWWDWEWTNGKR